jgi:DNA-binding NtrC family response regulator
VKRILIVDDEPSVLASLQRALRLRFGQRIHVETQVDALAALACARDNEFNVVISDLRMPAMDGVSFLARFALLQPHSVRMILTGSADSRLPSAPSTNRVRFATSPSRGTTWNSARTSKRLSRTRR